MAREVAGSEQGSGVTEVEEDEGQIPSVNERLGEAQPSIDSATCLQKLINHPNCLIIYYLGYRLPKALQRAAGVLPKTNCRVRLGV